MRKKNWKEWSKEQSKQHHALTTFLLFNTFFSSIAAVAPAMFYIIIFLFDDYKTPRLQCLYSVYRLLVLVFPFLSLAVISFIDFCVQYQVPSSNSHFRLLTCWADNSVAQRDHRHANDAEQIPTTSPGQRKNEKKYVKRENVHTLSTLDARINREI